MKRLALSFLFSAAFTLCYGVVFLLLVFGSDHSLLSWLGMPVTWPVFLYWRLYPALDGPLMSGGSLPFILYVSGCDILLYTFVAYCASLMLSILKRPAVKFDAPPSPAPGGDKRARLT